MPGIRSPCGRPGSSTSSAANVTTRSIVTGFVQPGQAALLAPFTAKYFAAIAGVWERRSSEVAQTVVIGLYPSSDVTQSGLDAADEFLSGDLPPALRRLVIEGKSQPVTEQEGEPRSARSS